LIVGNQDVGFRVCNVQRFRGGLVFKAHRLLYHSALGLRVIKKKKKFRVCRVGVQGSENGGQDRENLYGTYDVGP